MRGLDGRRCRGVYRLERDPRARQEGLELREAGAIVCNRIIGLATVIRQRLSFVPPHHRGLRSTMKLRTYQALNTQVAGD
jgi:hypothetical protein